ncbi:glycosyltransferase [Maribacter sp. CXY002]|uniref:glycosyltransferase n=1 Tax=Maribacter luteocoastalis TaxID=3407671 RepID=UPI003B67AA69
MKPTIHFYNNIASHYTKPLIKKILQSDLFELKYFVGNNTSQGIKNINFEEEGLLPYKNKINLIKNTWVKQKYLIWQKGLLYNCLFGKKIDLLIVLGEFNILSNWFAAIICRFRGIPVAFRGHGLYGNEGALKLFLRKSFYRLANRHLIYERRSKNLMISQGFKADSIHVMFNSLDYDQHKKQRTQFGSYTKSEVFDFFEHPELQTLIFIGRLTKIKKLGMLLEAVKKINESASNNVNLLIIGDGVERENLENYAENNIDKGHYHFYGSCYSEEIIGKLISKSDLCISPGNVGLTAIHSLSLGTPVCTHSNFNNQMPEVESITNGETGIFFEENNIDDLFEKISTWLLQNPSKSEKTIQHCYKIIDDYYNPHFQEKVFYSIAVGSTPII